MKLHASLHNTQDQPHPVYLNIRLWAQPSHAPCRLRRHTALIAVHSARARSRVLSDPHGLALPVRALAAHRWPRLDARLDVDPSVPLVLPLQPSKAVGPRRFSVYDWFCKNTNTGIGISVKYDGVYCIFHFDPGFEIVPAPH